MAERICIIEGVRTPFVKSGAELREVAAEELGRVVVQELLDRCGRPGLKIDAVVIGNIIGPAEASNIGRVIALKAGLPATTTAYSINMNCASALLALAQGCDLIKQGKAKVVIAGGTESMSHAPLQFPAGMGVFLERMMRAKSLPQKLAALSSFRLSHLKPIITLTLGLTDPISGLIMGDTAEILAKRYGIGRDEQDRFALRSHEQYFRAFNAGFYNDHVVTVFNAGKKGGAVPHDIGPRANLTLAQLAKLKPFFDKQFGTVTVGNSCPITDGAAACLLMQESTAKELGFKPSLFVRGYGFRGVAPEIMGLGPAVATPLALRDAGCTMKDIELVEINEAFAAQVIANQRVFDSPKLYQELTGESSPLSTIADDKLNVNGGAIALGHPVGTSGTRIVINLIKGMVGRDLNLGLASICVGGGLGGSMIIERGQ